MYHSIRVLGGLAVATSCLSLSAQVTPIQVESTIHHLGDSPVDWPGGAPDPEGLELRVSFDAKVNSGEFCLFIKHMHVDNTWPIVVNGVSIGTLERGVTFADRIYLLPAGALVDGENVLFLKSDIKTDDILVGDIRIYPETLREHFDLRKVHASVVDSEGRPVPAKITITDGGGDRQAKIFYGTGTQSAVRDGLVYTSTGTAEFEVAAGQYRVYASRGMEWGMDQTEVDLRSDAQADVRLTIDREIDTTGYVAADTHLHTITFGDHGDATVEERLVSLTAEGVELAVATDHNHNTDYRPFQQQLGLTGHFMSITGNEVTTPNGHFNAFPLDPEDEIPEHDTRDWVKLVEGIRAKGAKVVILNHPRWPDALTDSPFGEDNFELNRISGQRLRGSEFIFDAMELVNSLTMQPDPLFMFVDWFSLLNHGEQIMAVGSSDAHTIAGPVGQGRTYVRSSTDVPAEIDIDEICESFLRGYSSVSYGLFTEVWVEGDNRMGSSISVEEKTFNVTLRVASAAWARPDRARLFLNGRLVADRRMQTERGAPTDQRLEFVIATPPNDAHLVCVATGPGVRGRFWRSAETVGYVQAATNPVFIDADGDGKYSSPRETGLRIIAEHGMEPDDLVAPLGKVDDAVAVQVIAILYERLLEAAGDNDTERQQAVVLLQRLVERLEIRDLLRAYVRSVGGSFRK